MQDTHQPGFLQRLFHKFVYNPQHKRGLVSDLILKSHYNPITVAATGEVINADRGSRIDAVFTALNTIAREVASTPIDIKQDSDQGKIRRKDNPNYRLLAIRPNRKMTAYNFWYSNVFCYLAWGNAYNLIVRDGNMMPSQLIPLMPWRVRVIEQEGEIFYRYEDGEPIPARDILHFKAYSIDGINGVSPIEYNATLLGHKINQQTYSNNSLGKKPPIVFSGDVTEEQMDALTSSFTKRFADNNIPYINGNDVKMHALTIPPNEAQYLETSQYTDQKIYGLYNLPPTFAQDYDQGVKSNAEQQALTLVKHTLIPHYMLIEQECNEKLFPERNKAQINPLFVKFNANGKLRGDMQTRKDFYQTMLTSGVMNADEVRELEDMPKQAKGIGEKYYIQGAMYDKEVGPPQASQPPTEKQDDEQ